MDRQIENNLLSTVDAVSIELISNWVTKNNKYVVSRFSNDNNTKKILNKYIEGWRKRG